MKINWKLRLKNKVTLIALITLTVNFVYSFLAEVGITPKIDSGTILQFADYVIKLLAILGVIVDPTTEGIDDSELALKR